MKYYQDPDGRWWTRNSEDFAVSFGKKSLFLHVVTEHADDIFYTVGFTIWVVTIAVICFVLINMV